MNIISSTSLLTIDMVRRMSNHRGTSIGTPMNDPKGTRVHRIIGVPL